MSFSPGVFQAVSVVFSIIAAVLAYTYEIRVQNRREITAILAGVIVGTFVQVAFLFFLRPLVVS